MRSGLTYSKHAQLAPHNTNSNTDTHNNNNTNTNLIGKLGHI